MADPLGCVGVSVAAEAWRNLLQSESGHVLPQGSWPHVVDPSTETICTGCQEGVGSDLCLLIAFW